MQDAVLAHAISAAVAAPAATAAAAADDADAPDTSATMLSFIVGPTPLHLSHTAVGDIDAAPTSAAASSESLLSSSAAASHDPRAAAAHASPFTAIQRDMNEFFTIAHLTESYIRQSTLDSDHAAADKWIARLRATVAEWPYTDAECSVQLQRHRQHADRDSIAENRELCQRTCKKLQRKLAVIDARRQLPVLEAELEEATAAYEMQVGAHPSGLFRVR